MGVSATTTLALRARRYAVPAGQRLLPHLSERRSRTSLATMLRHCPQLWGWSTASDRRRAARASYKRAFPDEDADAFMAEIVATQAQALASSVIYMARTQAGRGSSLVEPLVLGDPGETPRIFTYLHYAIDPVVQLAFLAANPRHDCRWVVFPTRLNEPLRWEGERALYLASGSIPGAISERLLSVTDSSWLIEALRHLKMGGSILLALDARLDSRRRAVASLSVGASTLPVSPAIDLLAGESGAQRAFMWPEPHADGTWSLHHDHFPDTAAIAAAASAWIDEHRLYWAGWPYLSWRLKTTDMRPIVSALS